MTTASSITILIVEDNTFMQSAIDRMILDMVGLEVIGFAESGTAAVELAGEMKPSVVLMDINMPEMDGIEAARQIKLKVPDTRILMVSGDEGDDAIVAAFAAGADGFCTKSTILEQLEIAIRTVCSGKAYLDPVIGEKIFGYAAASNPALKYTVYSKLGLTALEIDIFQLMTKKQSEEQIALAIQLAVDDVKEHIRSIRRKLTGKQN
jgi:DNA-binding NarL/FixJ family response regulator